MARRFAKVSEEEIEEAFFYPTDLVNTKTTIPLRFGEERYIEERYIPRRFASRYISTSPSGDSCILSTHELTILKNININETKLEVLHYHSLTNSTSNTTKPIEQCHTTTHIKVVGRYLIIRTC